MDNKFTDGASMWADRPLTKTVTGVHGVYTGTGTYSKAYEHTKETTLSSTCMNKIISGVDAGPRKIDGVIFDINSPNFKTNINIGGVNAMDKEFKMSMLYAVVVVTQEGEIALDKKCVADTPNDASFEAGVDVFLRENNLRPKDVTVICNMMGSVRIKI